MIHLKLKKVFNAYEKIFDVMYECKNGWDFYNANGQKQFNANMHECMKDANECNEWTSQNLN